MSQKPLHGSRYIQQDQYSNQYDNQYGNLDHQSDSNSIHKPRRPIKQGLYMSNEAAKMDKNFKLMYP